MIHLVRWVELTRTFSNPDSHFLGRQVLKELVVVFVNNKSAIQRSPPAVKAVGLKEAQCRKHSHLFEGGTVPTKQIGTILQSSLPLTHKHARTHTPSPQPPLPQRHPNPSGTSNVGAVAPNT